MNNGMRFWRKGTRAVMNRECTLKGPSLQILLPTCTAATVAGFAPLHAGHTRLRSNPIPNRYPPAHRRLNRPVRPQRHRHGRRRRQAFRDRRRWIGQKLSSDWRAGPKRERRPRRRACRRRGGGGDRDEGGADSVSSSFIFLYY